MKAESGGLLLAGSVFFSCGLGYIFHNEAVACVALGACLLCMGLLDYLCRK